MATLIKIAERIINLDQLVYAQWDAGDENRKPRLNLVFERAHREWVPVDKMTPATSRDEVYLNMTFKGDAAEYVRNKH